MGGAAVCSHGCDHTKLNAECPSGYRCTQGAGPGGGDACIAAPSCSAVLQAFGQTCADDDACSGALADATCHGLVKDHGEVMAVGYCTSRCGVDADCPMVLGFSCKSGVCVR
jgi:hypothetical protein